MGTEFVHVTSADAAGPAGERVGTVGALPFTELGVIEKRPEVSSLSDALRHNVVAVHSASPRILAESFGGVSFLAGIETIKVLLPKLTGCSNHVTEVLFRAGWRT